MREGSADGSSGVAEKKRRRSEGNPPGPLEDSALPRGTGGRKKKRRTSTTVTATAPAEGEVGQESGGPKQSAPQPSNSSTDSEGEGDIRPVWISTKPTKRWRRANRIQGDEVEGEGGAGDDGAVPALDPLPDTPDTASTATANGEGEPAGELESPQCRFWEHVRAVRAIRADLELPPSVTYTEEYPFDKLMEMNGGAGEALAVGTLWARANDLDRGGSPIPMRSLLSVLCRTYYEVASAEVSALARRMAGRLRSNASVWGSLPRLVDRTTMTPATMIWEGPKAHPNEKEARLYRKLREARDHLRRRTSRRRGVEGRPKPPQEEGIRARGGTGRAETRKSAVKHQAKAGPSGHPRRDEPRPRTPSNEGARGISVPLRPPPYAPSLPQAGRHLRFGEDGRVLGGGGKKKGAQAAKKG